MNLPEMGPCSVRIDEECFLALRTPDPDFMGPARYELGTGM